MAQYFMTEASKTKLMINEGVGVKDQLNETGQFFSWNDLKVCCINKALLQQALARSNNNSSWSASKERNRNEEDDFSYDVANANSLDLSFFKRITVIENLSGFRRLVRLSLDNNQIDRIENLDALVQLEYLNLSFNNIAKIEGLQKLRYLTEISLFENKIEVIEGLESSDKLIFLSIGNNRIKSILGDDLRHCLEKLESLMAINLKGNPVCEHENYNDFFIAFLPRLKYLDYRKINVHDKALATAYQKAYFASSINNNEFHRLQQTIVKRFPGSIGLKASLLDALAMIDDVLAAEEYVNMQLNNKASTDHNNIMYLIHDSVKAIFESTVAEIVQTDEFLNEKMEEIKEYAMQSTRKFLLIAEEHELHPKPRECACDTFKHLSLDEEMDCVNLIRKSIASAEVRLCNARRVIASLHQVHFESLEEYSRSFFDALSSSIRLNKVLEETPGSNAIQTFSKSEVNEKEEIAQVECFIEIRRKNVFEKMLKIKEDFLSKAIEPIASKIELLNENESFRSRNRIFEIEGVINSISERE